MKYLNLFDRQIPRVALGCDHFGETVSEDTALKEMDLYLSIGGSVFDTACSYGQAGPRTPSTSEVLVGRHLRSLERSSYVIITKGGHPDRRDMQVSRITEKELEYDINQSLDQLGTVPDWWLFHRDNPDIPAPELLDMANSYIDRGLTKNIGVSNWSEERIEEANTWAEKHSKVPFTLSQIQFSLASCTIDSWGDDTIRIMGYNTSLSWYEKTKMPYMCFSSQGRGILQKLAENRALGRAARFDLPANRRLAVRAGEIAERDGVSISDVCLAFITGQKSNSLAIAGATATEQLRQSLSGCDYTLSQTDMDELAKLRGSLLCN